MFLQPCRSGWELVHFAPTTQKSLSKPWCNRVKCHHQLHYPPQQCPFHIHHMLIYYIAPQHKQRNQAFIQAHLWHQDNGYSQQCYDEGANASINGGGGSSIGGGARVWGTYWAFGLGHKYRWCNGWCPFWPPFLAFGLF